MYKPVHEIAVRIWGQMVGALALDPQRNFYAFEYDPAFIRSGIELAPLTMPLSMAGEPFIFTNLPEATFYRLPAFIADALPDKFGNALINSWMAQRGVEDSSITPLDRLAYMGKRGMGALEFKPARSPSAGASTTAISLAQLVESARLAIQGNVGTNSSASKVLAQIIKVGTSAGGARAKAVIAWNQKTEEIRAGQFDVEPGFEHWLIKFDEIEPEGVLRNSKNYGRIEYAYYCMAKAAGISMSTCRLLEKDGRAHFMTKRFERIGNNKIHMQTLCGMANLDFNQVASHDYSQLFSVVEKLDLKYQAKEEVFRRMAFNVVAANCDDHTKNFSFLLRKKATWTLAPAYDVTHAYNPNGQWNHQHLMSVNGKFNKISRSDLLAVARRFGIGTADKVIDEVVQSVEAWPDHARKAGVAVDKITRIQNDFQLF